LFWRSDGGFVFVVCVAHDFLNTGFEAGTEARKQFCMLICKPSPNPRL
jgi:hypothetical protein